MAAAGVRTFGPGGTVWRRCHDSGRPVEGPAEGASVAGDGPGAVGRGRRGPKSGDFRRVVGRPRSLRRLHGPLTRRVTTDHPRKTPESAPGAIRGPLGGLGPAKAVRVPEAVALVVTLEPSGLSFGYADLPRHPPDRTSRRWPALSCLAGSWAGPDHHDAPIRDEPGGPQGGTSGRDGKRGVQRPEVHLAVSVPGQADPETSPEVSALWAAAVTFAERQAQRSSGRRDATAPRAALAWRP